MKQSISFRPINSLIFVSDIGGGLPPEPVRDRWIWANEECAAIACHPEQDGPTEITMGPVGEVDPGYAAEFNGPLRTPEHILVVSTVDDQILLSADVGKSVVTIAIWRSHPRWPEKVTIGYA